MPVILAINPNTSEAVTARVGESLRVTAPGVDWRLATGGFGARYVASEAAYAIAAHAALEAWSGHAGSVDAVLLACFGDPGLFALRELSEAPVVGLAEAAMRAAVAAGPRYAIVTGGVRWRAMLERHARALGLGDTLASVRTTPLTGGHAAADPEGAVAALAAECRAAQAEDGAQAVVLGGAGFAGLGARVAQAAGLAVIDSIEAGARAAEALAHGAPRPYARQPGRAGTPSTGLAAALAARLPD